VSVTVAAIDEEHVKTIARRLKSKIYSSSEVRAAVRCELQHILPAQLAEPYPFGLQADNRQYADDIGALAGELLRRLEHGPAGARNALLILASQTEPEKWWHDINSPAAKAFRQRLLKNLADLQRARDEIWDDKNVIGDHPIGIASRIFAPVARSISS
jgi:hypothetical protein